MKSQALLVRMALSHSPAKIRVRGGHYDIQAPAGSKVIRFRKGTITIMGALAI